MACVLPRWPTRVRASVVSPAVTSCSSSRARRSRCACACCARRFGAEGASLHARREIQLDGRLLRDFALQIAAQCVAQRLYEFAGTIARIHFELLQADVQRLGRLHVQRLRLVSLVANYDLELRALALLATV